MRNKDIQKNKGRSHKPVKKNDNEIMEEEYKFFLSDSNISCDLILKGELVCESIDNYLDRIDVFINKYKSKISMTQLRRIYGDLKKMDSKRKNEDILLNEVKLKRIQLTYIAGRQEKPEAKFFCQLLLDAIKRMQTKGEFENFMRFFEAIISFHKYHDKK